MEGGGGGGLGLEDVYISSWVFVCFNPSVLSLGSFFEKHL